MAKYLVVTVYRTSLSVFNKESPPSFTKVDANHCFHQCFKNPRSTYNLVRNISKVNNAKAKKKLKRPFKRNVVKLALTAVADNYKDHWRLLHLTSRLKSPKVETLSSVRQKNPAAIFQQTLP